MKSNPSIIWSHLIYFHYSLMSNFYFIYTAWTLFLRYMVIPASGFALIWNILSPSCALNYAFKGQINLLVSFPMYYKPIRMHFLFINYDLGLVIIRFSTFLYISCHSLVFMHESLDFIVNHLTTTLIFLFCHNSFMWHL